MILALILAAAAPETLTVLDTDFQAEQADDDGNSYAVSTTKIPNLEGICYRWTMKVPAAAAVVPVVEVLTLPREPEAWGGVDDNDMSPTKLTENGRIATTTLFVSLKSGTITNGWCVAEGDPDGRYSLTVSYHDKLLKKFDFTIGDGPGKPRRTR